jgi:NADH:ubiquinone oxidoreductase subunit 3 (subunit A)
VRIAEQNRKRIKRNAIQQKAKKQSKQTINAPKADFMTYNQIAAVTIILLSLAVPFLLVFISKMMQKKASGNKVKDSPYESGEEPIGRKTNFESEYLSYFVIFLPMEFVAVLLLLSTALPGGTQQAGEYVVLLLVFAAIVSLILYKTVGGKIAE